MLIECDLTSQAIHKLIGSVQACYLEDGASGVEQWVDTWLVRIVNVSEVDKGRHGSDSRKHFFGSRGSSLFCSTWPSYRA
jgi:hypothetical protein